jgi:hypothetical protein
MKSKNQRRLESYAEFCASHWPRGHRARRRRVSVGHVFKVPSTNRFYVGQEWVFPLEGADSFSWSAREMRVAAIDYDRGIVTFDYP